MINTRIKITLLLVLIVFSGSVQASQVVTLYNEGKINAIRIGLEGGMWSGTVSEKLAQALTEETGLEAMLKFQEIATDSKANSQQQSLAWFNLYGYRKLVADAGGISEAIKNLNNNKQLSSKYFADGKVPTVTQPEKPATPSGSHYAVQIGAFGSKGNAERLAAKERGRGFTVYVSTIKRPTSTLYAVRVGKFEVRNDAVTFGRKYYGREGKDFSVVK